METNPVLIPEDKVKALRSQYLGGDLVDLLRAPTPSEWIKSRPIRGGGSVDYIPGAYFTMRLNDCFGCLWSYEVKGYFERWTETKDGVKKNGQLVGLGRLTIRVPGRTITRELPDGTKEIVRFDPVEIVKEQFGGSDIKTYSKDVMDKSGKVLHKAGESIDIGDDYKAMATDAKKKCGTELGMFLDIYGPREGEEENSRGKEDRVSGGQLDVLFMRGEGAGMNEEETREWAEEELGKPLDRCTPLEVMALIPKLVEKAKGRINE